MPRVKHIAIKSVDNLKGKGYHSGGSARHSPQEQRKMNMEARNLSNSQVLAGPSAKPPLRTTGKTQAQPKGITTKDLAKFRKEKLQRKSITRAQKDAQAKKELSPQQFAQYNKEKASQQKIKNSKSYQALEGYKDSLKASGANFNNLSPKQKSKLDRLSGVVRRESLGQGPKPLISPKMKPLTFDKLLTPEQKAKLKPMMKANLKKSSGPVRKSTMFGQGPVSANQHNRMLKGKFNPYQNLASSQAKAMKTFNKNKI